MRISQLVIKNFRSIKDLDIELPQICALVGPNNAGKSNILLAIQRVLGRDWVSVSSFDEDDVYSRNSDLDVEITVTLDPPLKYVKFKNTDSVDINKLSFEYTRYKIGEHKGERRLEQKCLDANDQSPSILAEAPKKGQQHKYERLYNIPSEVRESIPIIFIGTNRSLKEQLPSARNSMLRQLFEDINRDLHDPDQTIKRKTADGKEEVIPRIEYFNKLMEAAVKVLRTDSFIDLEKSIKSNALRQLGFDPEVDSDKLDLYFSPFDTMSFYKQLDLRVREGEFTISAVELGEGIQNALVLSILQVFEERRKKGAIILIEEPEMFLHPQMQRSLYKTIRNLGETNQVIYTTHSPHFVSIPDYQEVLLVRKGDDGTQIRQSTLSTENRRKEKLIKEFDPERCELFFASRLLLVEGDTEKLALPVYAARLGIDIDREGATIVEVGGKRNLPEFADIASSFGIPTGILYDKDSSDFKDKRNDEVQFNKDLDFRNKDNESCRVWCLDKNYEDNIKKELGEDNYQKLCAKFPNVSKAVRARLIAMDDEFPVPNPLKEVLIWLANKNVGS